MSRPRPPVRSPGHPRARAVRWLLVLAALGYVALVLPASVAALVERVASSGWRGLFDDWTLSLMLVVLAVAPVAFSRFRGAAAGVLGVVGASAAIGGLFGLAGALQATRANGYLSQGLEHLALERAGDLLTRFVLLSLLAAAIALLGLAVLRRAGRLPGGGPGGRFDGILSAAAVAALGALWLLRSLVAGAGMPVRIGAVVLWVAVVALVGWLLQRRRGASGRPSADSGDALSGSSALLVALVVVLAVHLASGRGAAELGAPATNLIFISLDTLRADHLGIYGYPRATSPNLDDFARQGVVFRHAYSAAPWTLPSHMTLLTGIYPSHHGAVTKFNRLDPSHVLLSEILRNRGYSTMAVTDGGFLDQHYGYDGFQVFDAGEGVGTEKGVQGTVGGRVDRAIELLDSVGERPFFLFLHTYQVHCPYEPPAEFDLFSDPDYDGPIEVEGRCVDYYREMQDRMEARDYQHVADKYDGEILLTDHHMGRFFAYLERTGRLQDSLVVITSDHGENLGDHAGFQLGHSQLYDHTMHVPLIVRGPELPAGRVVDEAVEGVDVMPTILELLGVPWGGSVDGRSFAGLAAGAKGGKQYVFGEKFPSMRMVRTDHFKLIQRTPGELELYNLDLDPGEHHDLLGEVPEEERLRAILDHWGEAQDERLLELSEGQVEVPDQLHAKLEALGYID